LKITTVNARHVDPGELIEREAHPEILRQSYAVALDPDRPPPARRRRRGRRTYRPSPPRGGLPGEAVDHATAAALAAGKLHCSCCSCSSPAAPAAATPTSASCATPFEDHQPQKKPASPTTARSCTRFNLASSQAGPDWADIRRPGLELAGGGRRGRGSRRTGSREKKSYPLEHPVLLGNRVEQCPSPHTA
jgi:hypothetical protein